MKTRIQGFDLARSFAIFGMVLVNFKLVVQAPNTTDWLTSIAHVFEGRAAPLFVMLAGVGLSFMSKQAIETNEPSRLRWQQKQILKRGVVLAMSGLAFLSIWPADILHFYGLYFILAAFVIHWSAKKLMVLAVVGNVMFLLCILSFDYSGGWDWETLTYIDLWSVGGFLRHWWFNGFHPAPVWMSFLLAGIWLGRQPMSDPSFIRTLMWRAILVWLVVQLVSMGSDLWLKSSALSALNQETLSTLLSVSVMPPMPLYVVSVLASSIVIMTLSIELCIRFPHWKIIHYMVVAGRQSLTIYVAHVFVGMGVMEALGILDGSTLEMAFLATGLFILSAVAAANVWARYFKQGLFEWIFRTLTR